MPNNWEEWDKAHGRGGGSSSADKLAAMIKGTLGHDAAPRADHGTHGSVVHRTTKADMKRPAPVKGEKDRADSTRTRIRMAAYQRKKAEAVSQDPTDRRTPKVEQQVNPHKATSAAKIADQVKGPSRADREAESRRLQVSAPAAGQAAYHSGAAEDHQKAADQYRQLQRAATRKTLRDWAEGRAKEHEAGVFAAKAKTASGPTDEQKAAHYKMMSGRAQTASESAKTASGHRDAAKAHERAAELAPSSALKLQHRNLADNHTASAAVEDRAEATRATSQAARERAAVQAKESAAARERLAARQAAAKSATQPRASESELKARYGAARTAAVGRSAAADTPEQHAAAAQAHRDAERLATTKAQAAVHRNKAAAHDLAAKTRASLPGADRPKA